MAILRILPLPFLTLPYLTYLTLLYSPFLTSPCFIPFHRNAQSKVDITYLHKQASDSTSLSTFAMIVRSYDFRWGWLCALVCWLVIVAFADCYDVCPLHLGESGIWEMVEGERGKEG